MDLSLNNQPWLICHKTKPNQTKYCSGEFGVPLHGHYSQVHQIDQFKNYS